MGPVKNPPSPQSNLKKDNSSSEDMAPAAKSRRLLNSCLLENQKLLRLSELTDDRLTNEKTLEDKITQQLKIPFFSENNENALNSNKKPLLQSVSSSTNSALSAASMINDVLKCSPDITRIHDLAVFESNGEKLENGSAHSNISNDAPALENHNSNTSSAPEELENSPFETKEKPPCLSEWTKDFLGSSLEFSSSVKDSLSDMVSDCEKLCSDTSRQLASSYFAQTATSVDKLIDQHASSQGGQSFMQTTAFRRYGPSVEREHKFCDVYLKPHLKGLKTEFDLDSDSTDESSDEELSFPSGSGNFISGNEPSSMPQSPASTVSDFSTFSTNTDQPQSATHPLPAVEKTFPAERNYLRRRADMHAVWTWLSMRYRAQKRQLKKLNHIYTHLQRTIPQARRRDQVTRCSSPESTPTLLTGPPTPVSCSETGGIEGEANGVGGDDLTAARVRPFIRENLVTANVQQSAAQVRSPTHSRCILSRYHELLDSVCGKPSVQCHCKYPEVSPCILCCGGAVDRELNPTNAAKSSRLQLPPPEKLYPRHKLDLSYHEKLSRPSDLCHSLSYDEAFVSRRPRLYFFSQTKPSSSLPAAQSRNGPPNQVPKRADKPLPQEPPEPPQARQEARLEGRSTSHEPWLKESPKLFGRQYAAFLRRRRGRRKQHPYGRRERTGEELDPYEEDARFRQLDVERQRQPIIRPRRQMVGRHRQSARKPQAPNGGMRGIVVNIPGLRRPRLQLSRVVVAPGSFDEEDTASVSSAGGSVKSHRSTAKEAESSSDQRAGIEIPYWHRLHTGPGDESAVMHLSSHRFANSGDPEARDTPSNHRTLPEEAKEDGKSLEVPSYQLVMLEKPRNGNEVEDTSDLAYVQRHKSAEMFERSTNYPSRGRPGNKAPARGDLSVHPGEFLG